MPPGVGYGNKKPGLNVSVNFLSNNKKKKKKKDDDDEQEMDYATLARKRLAERRKR